MLKICYYLIFFKYVLVLVKMYLYSAFSNVVILINVLGPRSGPYILVIIILINTPYSPFHIRLGDYHGSFFLTYL